MYLWTIDRIVLYMKINHTGVLTSVCVTKSRKLIRKLLLDYLPLYLHKRKWRGLKGGEVLFLDTVTMEMKKHHKRARRKLPLLKLCSCMTVEQEEFPEASKPYDKPDITSSTSSPPSSSLVSIDHWFMYKNGARIQRPGFGSLGWVRDFHLLPYSL